MLILLAVSFVTYLVGRQVAAERRPAREIAITIVDEAWLPLAGVTIFYEDEINVPLQGIVQVGIIGRPSPIGPSIKHRKVRTTTSNAAGKAYLWVKWRGQALSAIYQGSELAVLGAWPGRYKEQIDGDLSLEEKNPIWARWIDASDSATEYTVVVTSLEKQRAKAAAGDRDAQYLLACWLQKGRSSAGDQSGSAPAPREGEAREMFCNAAEQGDNEAQHKLGVACTDAGDYQEAIKWFRMAYKNGYVGNSESDFGKLYRSKSERQLGPPEDEEEARYLLLELEREARQRELRQYEGGAWGNVLADMESIQAKAMQGDARAQTTLGTLYRTTSTPRNFRDTPRWDRPTNPPDAQRAATLYRKAAEQGNVLASFYLGYMHLIGTWNPQLRAEYGMGRPRGIPEDRIEGMKWLHKAGAENDASAQFYLGIVYATGLFAPVNHAEAVRWYRLAANQGDKRAQRQLSYMYAKGLGVSQDPVQAYVWWQRGKNLSFGQEQGDELLKEIKTPAQKLELSRLLPGNPRKP